MGTKRMRFINKQSSDALWLSLLLAGLSLTPAWADGNGHKHNPSHGNGHGQSRAIRAIQASDYFPVDSKKAALGQAIFFDKEFSGNRNISCSTCHSPLASTSDGLSINLGEGAHGFSVSRD